MVDSGREGDFVMKRGIYADYVDKRSVIALYIEDDGSVLLDDGVAYGSMNQWLSPFENDNKRIFFPVPEDCKKGREGWGNAWCVLRCSGCHRSISSQRDTLRSNIKLRRRGYQPMYFQMAPIPVNVEDSWFFNSECWGDKPCIDADPELYDVDPYEYAHFGWCTKGCTEENTES